MQITHSEYYDDITGVLLAGGASQRMGYDKALIKLEGDALYTRALELLRLYFRTIIIAGDRPDLSCPGIQAIPDIYPGSALGGLYTSLRSVKTDWIFVSPCDMPYPDHRILELLIANRNGFDAIVPRTPEGYEPVFAVYHKKCLPVMEAMLKRGEYRIYDFYQKIKVHYLYWHQMPEGWERSLLNLNTPEQLEQFRREQE